MPSAATDALEYRLTGYGTGRALERQFANVVPSL